MATKGKPLSEKHKLSCTFDCPYCGEFKFITHFQHCKKNPNRRIVQKQKDKICPHCGELKFPTHAQFCKQNPKFHDNLKNLNKSNTPEKQSKMFKLLWKKKRYRKRMMEYLNSPEVIERRRQVRLRLWELPYWQIVYNRSAIPQESLIHSFNKRRVRLAFQKRNIFLQFEKDYFKINKEKIKYEYLNYNKDYVIICSTNQEYINKIDRLCKLKNKVPIFVSQKQALELDTADKIVDAIINNSNGIKIGDEFYMGVYKS